MYESKIRLRISAGDAHYGGGLVNFAQKELQKNKEGK